MADPSLLSVHDAVIKILESIGHRAGGSITVDLHEALGLSLAESIKADLDLPPFDKSIVDGYAVRGMDLASGPGEFTIVGEVLAGQTFGGAVAQGQTAAIMTGAPLPKGTDSVVMVERVEVRGSQVVIPGPIKVGQNRMLRGAELREGDEVARHLARLTPATLGVLASVGVTRVKVCPRPKVAIVATGDEIVEIGRVPGPGQIRNSNSTLLDGLMRTLGAETWISPVAPDEPEALERYLREALDGSTSGERPADILLISGGVSAGSRDLVPGTLERLGAKKVFHKVNLKPGKPLWYGTAPTLPEHPDALVFGLPGNPVSGLVCGLLFVAPALAALSLGALRVPTPQTRKMNVAFSHSETRETYYPARLTAAEFVEPLPWSGSSDLKTISQADGFLVLEPGENQFKEDDLVRFLSIPGGIAPDRWSRFAVFSE